MSYLVFGTFALPPEIEEARRKQIAFEITERALAQQLHAQLGHNIPHPSIVLEMLGIQKTMTVNPDRIPFLLTDSPLSDTSDELISPYYVGVEGDSTSIAINLMRIKNFLVQVLEIQDVHMCEILFTEGYDTSFREIPVFVDQFEDAAMGIFLCEPQIPSTRFVIAKRS